MQFTHGMLLLVLSLSLVGLTGCGPTKETVVSEPAGHDHAADDHAAEDHTAHDHSGWWCVEHGVPEEECALCDTSLVADFKSKGDWCDEHNRPDSQCFVCNPENFSKFAARYEAKFGEQPPQPTE